jgi:long-chain fatty acid transport protein
MNTHRLLSLSLALSTTLVSQTTLAAAFQLFELGTPIMGAAAVGQAANNFDASASYFNPAGMGYLKDPEFMIGSQIMVPYITFAKNTSNTISGDSGGNAGNLLPGASFYFVYPLSEKLKLGVSMTSPYGGALNYTDGWAGRYVIQSALFYTININPTVAYRFNDYVSVGGGLALEYMNLHQTVALPAGPIDGQLNIKVDNFRPGFNLGIMFTPTPATKIGVAYRSQISHDLTGSSTFLRFGSTPPVSTEMIMPHNIIASLSQDIGSRFTALGELGWSNWSSMQNSILYIKNVSATTPRKWTDTYRIGGGGQFKLLPNLIWQAGVSYDSSPTDVANRLPDLPMDSQWRAATGIIYNATKAITLGFSYEYWNLGSALIHNASTNGVLAGSYSNNFANIIQGSISVKL